MTRKQFEDMLDKIYPPNDAAEKIGLFLPERLRMAGMYCFIENIKGYEVEIIRGMLKQNNMGIPFTFDDE